MSEVNLVKPRGRLLFFPAVKRKSIDNHLGMYNPSAEAKLAYVLAERNASLLPPGQDVEINYFVYRCDNPGSVSFTLEDNVPENQRHLLGMIRASDPENIKLANRETNPRCYSGLVVPSEMDDLVNTIQRELQDYGYLIILQ